MPRSHRYCLEEDTAARSLFAFIFTRKLAFYEVVNMVYMSIFINAVSGIHTHFSGNFEEKNNVCTPLIISRLVFAKFWLV